MTASRLVLDNISNLLENITIASSPVTHSNTYFRPILKILFEYLPQNVRFFFVFHSSAERFLSPTYTNYKYNVRNWRDLSLRRLDPLVRVLKVLDI